MKHKNLIIPFKFFTILFLSCDNATVTRAEYDMLMEERNALKAENDSLRFELSDLMLYNDFLEREIDSLQQ